jgi:hypothetical protein
MRVVQHNASPGKGPCEESVGSGGACEGMAGESRPNSPRSRRTPVKVQRLQGRLRAAAKRSPERCFHALYDRIHRSDDRWASPRYETEWSRWRRSWYVRVLIEKLNPLLRGWANYFCTGNAAKKFRQVDRYVGSRLRRFLWKRKRRHLRPGEARAWTEDFFVEHHGLHRLLGTVRYPEAA